MTGQSHVIGSDHWNGGFWEGSIDYVQFMGERIAVQTLEDNAICPPLPVTENTSGSGASTPTPQDSPWTFQTMRITASSKERR